MAIKEAKGEIILLGDFNACHGTAHYMHYAMRVTSCHEIPLFIYLFIYLFSIISK